MVEISRKIRQTIMEVEIPSDVVTAVTRYLSGLARNRLMPYDPVQLQKIYRMPLLRVNKTPI